MWESESVSWDAMKRTDPWGKVWKLLLGAQLTLQSEKYLLVSNAHLCGSSTHFAKLEIAVTFKCMYTYEMRLWQFYNHRAELLWWCFNILRPFQKTRSSSFLFSSSELLSIWHWDLLEKWHSSDLLLSRSNSMDTANIHCEHLVANIERAIE